MSFSPEGVALWLASLVVLLLTGQLRQYVVRVSGLAAVALALVISFVIALVVQQFFGGGLHLPKDLTDFSGEALILFAIVQVVYKVIIAVFNPATRPLAARRVARLVG